MIQTSTVTTLNDIRDNDSFIVMHWIWIFVHDDYDVLKG
jgi:hypothetical protein